MIPVNIAVTLAIANCRFPIVDVDEAMPYQTSGGKEQSDQPELPTLQIQRGTAASTLPRS
jgi:hypothetical protein